MTELPLVICNIQRGGPSTGLPTKPSRPTCCRRCLGAIPKRPFPYLRPRRPGLFLDRRGSQPHCVEVHGAGDYSLGRLLANGAEPWRIPSVDEIPGFPVRFATDPEGFLPYKRDPETLARPWAIPGTPGLEHRIGGLEKQDVTGNINYEPLNHEKMVRIRRPKLTPLSRMCRMCCPAATRKRPAPRFLGLDVWFDHASGEGGARQGRKLGTCTCAT